MSIRYLDDDPSNTSDFILEFTVDDLHALWDGSQFGLYSDFVPIGAHIYRANDEPVNDRRPEGALVALAQRQLDQLYSAKRLTVKPQGSEARFHLRIV